MHNKMTYNDALKIELVLILLYNFLKVITSFLKLQYFNSGPNFGSDVAPNVGSSFVFTDYCPFESPFSVSVILTIMAYYCYSIIVEGISCY